MTNPEQQARQKIDQLLTAGWVMKNLVDENDNVEGLIICHSIEASLRYALEPANDIDLLTYEVDFHLRNPE